MRAYWKKVPFGAVSGSSPFRNGVFDLKPFHQFVREVFEGDDVTEEGCEGGDSVLT